MPASLLTRNVIAMAGFVAFALAYQRLSGLLMLDYGVDLYGWFTVSLMAMAAVSAAGVANRRTFQLTVPSSKRILLRSILVCSVAGAFFCIGFLATIQYLLTG